MAENTDMWVFLHKLGISVGKTIFEKSGARIRMCGLGKIQEQEQEIVSKIFLRTYFIGFTTNHSHLIVNCLFCWPLFGSYLFYYGRDSIE